MTETIGHNATLWRFYNEDGGGNMVSGVVVLVGGQQGTSYCECERAIASAVAETEEHDSEWCREDLECICGLALPEGTETTVFLDGTDADCVSATDVMVEILQYYFCTENGYMFFNKLKESGQFGKETKMFS